MRILMVSDVFFPRSNGVSMSVESFRHALAALDTTLDIEVHVVAPHYPQCMDNDGDVIRVPVRQVPCDPEDRLMRGRDLRDALTVMPTSSLAPP